MPAADASSARPTAILQLPLADICGGDVAACYHSFNTCAASLPSCRLSPIGRAAIAIGIEFSAMTAKAITPRLREMSVVSRSGSDGWKRGGKSAIDASPSRRPRQAKRQNSRPPRQPRCDHQHLDGIGDSVTPGERSRRCATIFASGTRVNERPSCRVTRQRSGD